MGWLHDRRARRQRGVLSALGEKEAGWFVPDLAKYLGRSPVGLHIDLAALEAAGLARSWWQDGPYPRRRLYGRAS